MDTYDRQENSILTIDKAVETLSHIADLEIDRNLGTVPPDDILLEEAASLGQHTIQWLQQQDASTTVEIVQETFRVILDYLKNYYKMEPGYIYDQQAIEGIKTIMVLVGEAAKKLDRYTALFNATSAKSVTELKEYKQLQEFYLNRVVREVDEDMLGKWIWALSQKGRGEGAVVEEPVQHARTSTHTKHVFVDLESVKKDTEYELFFLRKEDGSRFFSPRLIRNIKLVNDFGDSLGQEKHEDLLFNLSVWQDRLAHACAKNIVQTTRLYIDRFVRDAISHKDNELVTSVSKAIMGLLLAVNPHNLDHNMPIKSCRDYYCDFHYYLREALNSNDYKRLVAYPPNNSHRISHCLVQTIQAFCKATYVHLDAYQELLSLVHGVIQHSLKEDVRNEKPTQQIEENTICNSLNRDYSAMSKLLKYHPNGPLNKIIESLEGGKYSEFDPITQENIASQLYTLYVQESRYVFARWPSPTHQEFIHKADLIEEFKGFLHACVHDGKVAKCLLINMQDRVTWKEHARSAAIEELNHREAFDKHIIALTIAKDTEFYHQVAPYNDENNAEAFIQLFKDQLKDQASGFFIPKAVKDKLNGFIGEAMKAIHRIYFSEKNTLTRDQRLDFIEIFYLFLQLKVLEIVKPDVIGFSCKDAIDICATTSAELFVFLKLLAQERLSENDREQLDLMLYGPVLLQRERILIPERFNRMVSTIRVFESMCRQLGQPTYSRIIQDAFGHLYETPILQGKVIVQRNKDML